MPGMTVRKWRARAPTRHRATSRRPLRAGAHTLASALVIGLGTPATSGFAQESVHPLDAASARYREVTAICANFEQSIEVRLARRTIRSAGRVCQRRPNLFSMRFSDPDGDMVVSDGEYFWVYYPSLDAEQVMRYAVSGTPGGQDFFREFLEDPGARYEAEEVGTEAVDGRDCRVLTLNPRSGAAYRGARLWLDAENHLIRRVEIEEQSGNVRTVTLRDSDLSPAIDPGTFVFEVPAGARVMRGPGRPGARTSAR